MRPAQRQTGVKKPVSSRTVIIAFLVVAVALVVFGRWAMQPKDPPPSAGDIKAAKAIGDFMAKHPEFMGPTGQAARSRGSGGPGADPSRMGAFRRGARR